MTGPNEQRLIDFADTGSAWDMPGNLPLVTGLQSLKQVLQKVAENPGVMGQTGTAASTLFGATAVEVQEQITWVQVNAAIVISQANSVRERARESLANLPQGSMTEGQAAAVRGATVGATLVLGPVAFLAGEGAAAAINGYLSNQREEAAARAMSAHAAEMDKITLEAPPEFQVDRSKQPVSGDPTTDGTTWNGGGGGGSGRSGTPTFQPAPVGGPSGYTPGGGGGDFVGSDPSGGDEGRSDYGPFHIDVPQANLGPRPPIDLGSIPPTPTPDGPLNGSPTLPGVIPAAPGSGGLSGGAGAGLGSGLTAGLVAGGGGAAALANLARGAGTPGGSLFGGGTATSGTAARSGGLLGKTAPGGSGLGARGVGGLAGGGTAGGSTSGSSAARGAGMRAGGLAGAGGTGGTGAAGGATGAAGGGSRGVGGMGGPGSRSDRRNEAARGLGGPIAPRMEDDEEIGPRSENAQAGGRDD